MQHQLTIKRIKRWRENEYEGTIEGIILNHPVSCHVLLPSSHAWENYLINTTILVYLYLERSGSIQHTADTVPTLSQINGVNYKIVGQITAVGDHLTLQTIFPISLDLDPPSSAGMPDLKVDDWIEVTGVLKIEPDENDTRPSPATPFGSLTSYDLKRTQPTNPFTWGGYYHFIKDHRSKLSQRGDLQLGRKLVPLALNRQAFEDLPNVYRSQLPVYHLATCPICQGDVWEAIDTFSLMGIGWWRDEPLGYGWFGRPISDPHIQGSYLGLPKIPDPSYQSDCSCVKAVTYGVNLHQKQPDDVINNYVMLGSEVPGLLSPFMQQDGSYAVIRTLGVGGWEEPAWHAKYTLFIITYFNANPQSYRQSFENNDPQGPQFYWPYDELDYNLGKWLRKERLFIHPASDVNQILSFQGVTGRWCIRGRKLKLLPTKLVGRALMNRNHRSYSGIDKLETQALENR